MHVSRIMQPPVEHPDYEYPHDELLDRPRLGWPALLVATFVAFVALLFVLVR